MAVCTEWVMRLVRDTIPSAVALVAVPVVGGEEVITAADVVIAIWDSLLN